MIKKLKSMTKIIFVLMIIILCGILGYFTFKKIESSRQTNNLITFAEGLNYSPESHLAQYKKCWGIFPTTCGLVIYYTTSYNPEELQIKIDAVATQKELPLNPSMATLFDINQVTEHNLAVINENNSNKSTLFGEPQAYKWRLSKWDKDWVVTFYEIANDGHIYTFDGYQINGNIITIMMIIN